MFHRLRRWYYSLFIFNIRFIDKRTGERYDHLPIFSSIQLGDCIDTAITFTFKIDNKFKNFMCCVNYIVEAKVGDSYTHKLRLLNDKVLISATIFMFRRHYEGYANVLLHKFLERATEYLNTDL